MKPVKCGQWTIEIDEDTGEYKIMNLGQSGERQFYMVTPGGYGEPIITPEPDLAFTPPYMFNYVDVNGVHVSPMEKISGIICKDSHRLSLTNAKRQGINITVNSDGSLNIAGVKWWIATLFQKDKNRIKNYDAYCIRQYPTSVRVLELGDLDLF
ncbi:MAG: hypothetical protein Q7S24_00900 [bacterium]|nr:hypothetical protein [bacterium]